MPSARATALGARLTRLATRSPVTDADLLGRFTADRDGEAFAELVRRHGPAVLAACRWVTGHAHDAEDAFQATFLVLARRADHIRPGEPLGAWLYGVAVRVARKAARTRRELPGSVPDVPVRATESADADAARAVAEEVGRLSPRYRAAVVLCELEGRPRAAAARELGIAEGTLSSRLAAARKELADRLSARGFGPTALAVLAPLVVPPELTAATAALPGHPAPAAAAALATGVLRAMLVRHLPPGVLVLGLAAMLATALLAGPSAPAAPPAPATRIAVAAAQPPAPKAAPRPLPKGPNQILISKSGYLVLIDPDGRNEKRVSESRAEVMPVDARLSPDGTRVAYRVLVRKGEEPAPGQGPRQKLYVRTIGEKEPGTDTGVECQSFVWSPDGTRLVASNQTFDPESLPNPTHHLVDARTGRATPLKLPPNHLVTGWLADGDRFVTLGFAGTRENPTSALYLMNPGGTEHKRLTDNRSNTWWVIPSPDGTRVLVPRQWLWFGEDGRSRRGRAEVALLDVATGRQAVVEGFPLDGELRGACWSPDGKKIAYSWRQVIAGETESYLVVADPDGKNPRTILRETTAGQWVDTLGAPDWR